MPSLSDKLKSLGVHRGANHLVSHPHSRDHTIEQVAPGEEVETPAGTTYLVKRSFAFDYAHSPKARNRFLSLTSSRQAIAQWTNEPRLAEGDPTQIAFLDTETSGLSGGTGTFAFLVGVGRLEKDRFLLAQFFLREPSEEPALLLALESFLASSAVLVTFNGKAFDVPLLNTRYALQGWSSPLADLAQIDLLHLARRIWRDRLPSRTLGNLEHQILGTERTNQEVPGWMIPQLYFDYLRSGDARPLANVFYHNAMDVLSLATLLDHCAHLLAHPKNILAGEEFERVALARIYEDIGDLETATSLYRQCLQKDLPQSLYFEVLQRLSYLYKRASQYPAAVELWKQAAEGGQLYAYIEIAKYLEHHAHDYQQALDWVEQALRVAKAGQVPGVERTYWQPELEHRLKRLQTKLERQRSHPNQ